MASKEYLEERIRKAKETIEKKKNTIEKKEKLIEKKSKYVMEKYNIPTLEGYDRYDRTGRTDEEFNDIYWNLCDISNYEDDIKNLNNTIKEKSDSLVKYENELLKLIEKENSRNVTVLLDFLEDWKNNCIEFYMSEKAKYDLASQTYKEQIKEIREKKHNLSHGAFLKDNPDYEKYFELDMKEKKLTKEHRDNWSHVTQFFHGSLSFEETLEKDIEEEKFRKYDDIIERTNEIVGEITDASYLSVNQKGNLDGFILGSRGSVKVSTIDAGGYNIQCYHFRTLIHKVDDAVVKDFIDMERGLKKGRSR